MQYALTIIILYLNNDTLREGCLPFNSNFQLAPFILVGCGMHT